MIKLLSFSNPRTAESAMGYEVAILHLAPHDLSGRNVCARASLGCRFCCYNFSGRAGIKLKDGTLNTIQAARIRRTNFYFDDPVGFRRTLTREVESFLRRCERRGVKPALRLNGTSDLPKLSIEFATAFPGLQVYEYTKLLAFCDHDRLPPNLDLTFSRSEENEDECREALARGFRIAIVTDDDADELFGFPTVDGDCHDLRFLDPAPCVVRLAPNGRALRDRTGFVLWKGKEN